MATAYKADAVNRPAINTAACGEIVVQTGVYALGAAIALNDTIDLCKLPAGMTVDDLIIDTDDLDSNSTPLVVLEVGLVDLDFAANGGSDTSAPGCYIASSTIAQTGGVARLTNRAGRHIAPVDYDRYIRVQFTTAPATSAVTGIIKVSAFTRNRSKND